MADPWIVGDGFYTGQPFVDFSDNYPRNKERYATLVEISPKPVYDTMLFRTTPSNNLAFFYMNGAAPTISLNAYPTNTVAAPNVISSYPELRFFSLTDSDNVVHYITPNDGGGTLTTSTSKNATWVDDDGIYFGDFIHLIDKNGQKVWEMTILTNGTINITEFEDNPLRVSTIYISNGHPAPYDDNADVLYIEALVSVGAISNRLEESETGFSGVSFPQIGSVSVQILDGNYDFLCNQSFDNRDIVIKRGLIDNPISSYEVISKGKTLRAESNFNQTIEISLRDISILFDRKVQENTYLGTGGIEGTEELKGVAKKLGFGVIFDAEPVLLDANLQLYQYHDGVAISLANVYEGAFPRPYLGEMTLSNLLSWVPTSTEEASGGWKSSKEAGCFRLASVPTQPITCDFEGDVSASQGAFSDAGDICEALVKKTAPEIEIDANYLARFKEDLSYRNRIYIESSEITLKESLNEVLKPIGAVAFVSNDQKLRFDFPRRRAPVGAISSNQIIYDNSRSKNRRAPAPAKKYRIGYDRIWRVFTESEFLANVIPSRKEQFKNAYRYVTYDTPSYDGTSLEKYETTNIVTYETNLRVESSALALAEKLSLRDWSLDRLIDISVTTFGFELELGDTVLFNLEYWDMGFPRSGIIIGIIKESPTSNTIPKTNLTLWV